MTTCLEVRYQSKYKKERRGKNSFDLYPCKIPRDIWSSSFATNDNRLSQTPDHHYYDQKTRETYTIL